MGFALAAVAALLTAYVNTSHCMAIDNGNFSFQNASTNATEVDENLFVSLAFSAWGECIVNCTQEVQPEFNSESGHYVSFGYRSRNVSCGFFFVNDENFDVNDDDSADDERGENDDLELYETLDLQDTRCEFLLMNLITDELDNDDFELFEESCERISAQPLCDDIDVTHPSTDARNVLMIVTIAIALVVGLFALLCCIKRSKCASKIDKNEANQLMATGMSNVDSLRLTRSDASRLKRFLAKPRIGNQFSPRRRKKERKTFSKPSAQNDLSASPQTPTTDVDVSRLRLPDGWFSALDEESGHRYYYTEGASGNTQAPVSQWIHPALTMPTSDVTGAAVVEGSSTNHAPKHNSADSKNGSRMSARVSGARRIRRLRQFVGRLVKSVKLDEKEEENAAAPVISNDIESNVGGVVMRNNDSILEAWSTAIDHESGELFYFNTITNDRTWDEPLNFGRSTPKKWTIDSGDEMVNHIHDVDDDRLLRYSRDVLPSVTSLSSVGRFFSGGAGGRKYAAASESSVDTAIGLSNGVPSVRRLAIAEEDEEAWGSFVSTKPHQSAMTLLEVAVSGIVRPPSDERAKAKRKPKKTQQSVVALGGGEMGIVKVKRAAKKPRPSVNWLLGIGPGNEGKLAREEGTKVKRRTKKIKGENQDESGKKERREKRDRKEKRRKKKERRQKRMQKVDLECNDNPVFDPKACV